MILLHLLASKELPLTLEGGDDVDAVHVLVLAGHVEAILEKAFRAPHGWRIPKATVTKITASGKKMLRVFPAEFCSRSNSYEKLLQKLRIF